VHFFAHAGDQLKSRERKGDLRPEIHGVPIPKIVKR
jgi:hypothetical protein